MKTPLLVLLTAQCFLTGTAVIFNATLVVVIMKSNAKMGKYKYVMISFCIFEALFAIVCLVGMPMHSISDRTWIEFTTYGVLGNTRFARIGPILYCMMYEIWLGYIILNFIYRWIVLCKSHWADKIKTSGLIRILIYAALVYYLCLCFVCSLLLCPYDRASRKVLSEIRELFDIPLNESIGYYVIRLTSLDGTFSLIGLVALMVHYTAVLASTFVVAFCSYDIWTTIRQIQAVQQSSKISLEKQLFMTLLFQTIVPVFMCHIPSMFVLSFPLWEDNMTIGPLSSMFPLFLTITKVIDPLCSLCIKEFRKTLWRMLTCWERNSVSSNYVSSLAQPPTSQDSMRSVSTHPT